jgi:quinol monooxygenase YgiN
MITRIVRLHLHPDTVATFLAQYAESYPHVSTFVGVHALALYRDATDPNVYYTHSQWASLAALEDYRRSPLFKGIWASLKPLFAAPAQAFSLEAVG